MLKKLLLSAIMPAMTVAAYADTAMTYDTYDDTYMTCTVTGWRGDQPTGVLTINANHKKDGKTYKVTRIASDAFNNLPEVTEVVIGKNVKKIGQYSQTSYTGRLRNFFGMPKLKKFTVQEGNEYFTTTPGGSLITKAKTELLRVPQKCGTSGGVYAISSNVTWVKPDAFKDNSTITTIELPFSILDFDDRSVNTMKALAKFQLGESCTGDRTGGGYRVHNDVLYCGIGTSPYEELLSYPPLKTGANYKCPAGTKLIHDFALANTPLRSIDINGVTQIGEEAMAGSGITSLTLPAAINRDALKEAPGLVRDCKSLKTLILKTTEKVEIPDNFARGCTSLTTVTYGATPDHVGLCAFKGCSSLKSYPFDFNSTIGDSAFAECGFVELAPVTAIKASVGYHQRFGHAIFANCPDLTTIDFTGITQGNDAYLFDLYDSFAPGCTRLNTVIFSPIQRFVSNAAFGKTPYLKKVIIPSDRFNNCTETNDYVASGFNNSCVFSSNTTNTFAPDLYMLTSSGAKVDISKMFTVLNSTGKLAPNIFYQGTQPVSSPFSNAGATSYVPGGCLPLYSGVKGTKVEMYSFSLIQNQATGQAELECRPLIDIVAITSVMINDTPLIPAADGSYTAGIDYSLVESITVSYTANDVAMQTVYTRDNISAMSTTDINADSSAAKGIAVSAAGLSARFSAPADYTVMTTSGIIVARGNGTEVTLPASGIYILTLTAPDGSTAAHKLSLR